MKRMTHESSLDLKHSLKLLWKNYKPFLKVQLLALSLTLITFFIIIGIGFVYRVIFNTSIQNEPIRYIGGAFMVIFNGFIWIFMASANGLAMDIIDSGDEFTEFQNVFKYLAKHWWKYALIAVIVYGLPNALQGVINHPRVQGILLDMSWGKVLLYESVGIIASYLIYSLFMLTFSSVTFQGNFKHAFIENFRILRKDWKRVFGTWGLFFLIFHVPPFIFATLALILHIPLFGIIWGLLMLFNMFIGIPLSYIMGAGMYFNINFERFKPLE